MAPFTFAFLLCGFAGQKPPAWPAVTGGTVRVSRGAQTRAPKTDAAPSHSGSEFVVTLKAPTAGLDRVAVEFLVVPSDDGTIVKFQGKTIGFKGGVLGAFKDGEPSIHAPIESPHLSQPLDLTFVTRATDVAIYVNGQFYTSYPADGPSQVAFVRSDWSKSLQGLVTFARPMSPGQVLRNAKAGIDFVHGVISGPPVATVELQLGEFTAVPDPVRIKPYRNALLADEFKVLDVIDAGSTSLKAGDTVRVFRYGVLDGKQTAVKDLKSGDHVRLKIEPMSAAGPNVQNEYQLDSLNTSFDPYFVEVMTS